MSVIIRCDGCGHEKEGPHINTYEWGTLLLTGDNDKHYCPTCMKIITKPFPAALVVVRN